jgi:required for meiotic nuclear division protein 1
MYPQVVHAQEIPKITQPSKSNAESDERGDVFVFPSGTIVTWNVAKEMASDIVHRILKPAAVNSHLHLVETEHLGYLEDPSRHFSSVIGDTIVLGTGLQSQSADEPLKDVSQTSFSNGSILGESGSNRADPTLIPSHVDRILAKIAFSSGLARSTKLSVLETLLNDYFESIRSIPIILSRGSKVPFTRSFILRKTGELLNIRAQLNLYSEITDSLPDLFWDSRHELGLEGYYDEVGRALDVGIRIKVLNEKMDYAQEIANVLRERLSEKHGLLLEWLIIALISVEVILEFWRHWKEKEEKSDPNSMESLLKRYISLHETK